MPVKFSSPIAFLTLIAVFVLSGCDLFVGTAGEITVKLKDDPFPYTDVEEARVSITRIEMKGANGTGNWLVADLRQDLDLLQLRDGKTATVVSSVEIPAGEYNHVQIYLSPEAELKLTNGKSVQGSRGVETPITVQVPQFKMDHGEDQAEAVIDFVMDESFTVQRNATTQEIESFSYTPVLVTESFTLNKEPIEVVVP
jgi:hypothetical protein